MPELVKHAPPNNDSDRAVPYPSRQFRVRLPYTKSSLWRLCIGYVIKRFSFPFTCTSVSSPSTPKLTAGGLLEIRNRPILKKLLRVGHAFIPILS
eukprot:4321757-Pyramimonas_sp.AAC.1